MLKRGVCSCACILKSRNLACLTLLHLLLVGIGSEIVRTLQPGSNLAKCRRTWRRSAHCHLSIQQHKGNNPPRRKTGMARLAKEDKCRLRKSHTRQHTEWSSTVPYRSIFLVGNRRRCCTNLPEAFYTRLQNCRHSRPLCNTARLFRSSQRGTLNRGRILGRPSCNSCYCQGRILLQHHTAIRNRVGYSCKRSSGSRCERRNSLRSPSDTG